MYSTQAGLINQFGLDEVQDLAGNPDGTINEARVNDALARASDEADSYLACRYAVPLNPVPRVLVGYINSMARYHLCGNSYAQDAESVTRRYDAAIAWLKNVAKGLADIPSQQPPTPPVGGGSGPTFYAGERVW
ncbi:MAG: DUF1320 domain-containing protein [Desulfovibrionaceae bacterium]